MSNLFKSIVKACPYTFLGKTCVRAFKNNPSTDKHLKDKTEMFKSGIKMGRNIALVGVFCPFLWFSILSGASKDFIILNAIHSGIIVVLGLVILSINYVVLYSYTKSVEKG